MIGIFCSAGYSGCSPRSRSASFATSRGARVMDQVAYVLYAGDARLWHQRRLLGTVESCPGKAIWVSPDDDVQWESVDLSCGNMISAVRWASTIRPSPPGVGRVYRFAAAPNAAREARRLAECPGVADNLYRVVNRRMATGATGRLTVDELAAFGAAAKARSKLLICPALLEAAKVDVERESALSRALLKAREARASLAKKDGK